MDTSVQIVLKSATEPVVAAIKKVVYVITDANPDGEEYIVKMVFFDIAVKSNFAGIKLSILASHGFLNKKKRMVDKDNFRNIS